MNEMILNLLETKNAKCIIPLLNMIGNLDQLVENGVEGYNNSIPNKIRYSEKRIQDILHIFEDSSETLSDSDLVNNAKMLGESRRERRDLKTEGVFLDRENIHELLESFIKLVNLAKKGVSEKESQMYLMRVLDAPNESTRLVDRTSTKTEQVKTPAMVECDENGYIQESTNLRVVNGVRIYGVNDILTLGRDNLLVKEGIEDYTNNVITKDSEFDLARDMKSNWVEIFNKTDHPSKREMLFDLYKTYYSDPVNPMIKEVADFAMWNYILPKHILENHPRKDDFKL